MQSAIHRAAETPSQIRMREEAKLRRARMSVKPAAIVKIVPVVSAQNTAATEKKRAALTANRLKRRDELRAKDRPRTTSDVRKIQVATALHFGASLHDLLGERGHPRIALARLVAMYLAREMTLRSFPYIGRYFGGRDHTTVLKGCRSVEDRLQTDEQLAVDVAAIKAVLA